MSEVFKFRHKSRRGLDPMMTMINVVFLLLAFFMLGHFDEPAPKSIELPIGEGDAATEQAKIIITRESEIQYSGQMGDAAIELAVVQNTPFLISADARLEAGELIDMMNQLQDRGIELAGLEVRQ